MKIFVAGATGVIGRRVVPMLASAGHHVTALSRKPENSELLESLGATPCTVSLFDRTRLQAATAGQDAVINLATHIPAGRRLLFRWAWRENDRIRSIGSRNLADAAWCAGAGRFIQESFGLGYRDNGGQWIDEDRPLDLARYNASVGDAEAAAAEFTGRGGTGVVLRFAGFYGADSPQTLELIRLARRGWAVLPGPAQAFYSSVSHDDAATAVLAALDVSAGTYNVVDDEPVTRADYFQSLATALGVSMPRFLPAWLQHLGGSVSETLSRSLRLSNRRLKAEAKWTPTHKSVVESWKHVLDG